MSSGDDLLQLAHGVDVLEIDLEHASEAIALDVAHLKQVFHFEIGDPAHPVTHR